MRPYTALRLSSFLPSEVTHPLSVLQDFPSEKNRRAEEWHLPENQRFIRRLFKFLDVTMLVRLTFHVILCYTVGRGL
jgi:hypothetical protein